MKKTLQVINNMVKDGIISDYAIGGSIGVMVYTEPFFTKDVDIFIYPQCTPSGIVHLVDIYQYLKSKNYRMRGQYFVIEGAVVDFVPVYNRLTEDALNDSIKIDYSDIKINVFRPEYLIAIAIQTGRPQDAEKVRKLTTLSNTKIDNKLLARILKKHNLKL